MSERGVREKMELRRKAGWSTTLVSFLICLFIGAASLGVYAGFRFTDKSPSRFSAQIDDTILPTMRQNMTVMLLGVDERKDDVGRSDTLMFLNFNRDDVSLLSIPRDTRVYMGRRGYQKINAAYAFGGERLARKTVEDFLGVDVDRYIKIDKHAFPEIIDILGGIDIYVERDMKYEDPWDDDGGLYINLRRGYQHLDGEEAVQFVRFRDEEGDAGRIRRQQVFMKALAEKITDPSIILKLPQIFTTAMDAIDTDLSLSELLALAGTLKVAESEGNIQTGVVPGYWQYIDNVSYLVPDAERLGEVVLDNLNINSSKRHFEKLALDYDIGSPADFYDVNPNLERDLKIMEDFHSARYDFKENKL
ncbi:MAG: LCP family protein [Selenomonadaceae bacterium]|nr:LCP family protein [Selenomonadaceae bacterium]